MVFITTILGCLFAVIVTFVPCPLFNQRKAHSEMATVSKTVSAIWSPDSGRDDEMIDV